LDPSKQGCRLLFVLPGPRPCPLEDAYDNPRQVVISAAHQSDLPNHTKALRMTQFVPVRQVVSLRCLIEIELIYLGVQLMDG
jgi:hypothetical protein